MLSVHFLHTALKSSLAIEFLSMSFSHKRNKKKTPPVAFRCFLKVLRLMLLACIMLLMNTLDKKCCKTPLSVTPSCVFDSLKKRTMYCKTPRRRRSIMGLLKHFKDKDNVSRINSCCVSKYLIFLSPFFSLLHYQFFCK